ncbi:MAG: metallophosphoesterase [Bacilli bacterium]|nr:metallophosphoesterase [Bacilli bacterium]
MIVVVISDAHGDQGLIRRVAEMENKADAFIDAGDSCLEAEDIRPFISVKGNCDFSFYPLSRILYFEGWRVYLTHGAGLSKSSLINIAKSHECSVLIYGHTHKYEDSINNSIYCLNPGSISRPRDGYMGTYMVIEFSENDIKIKKKEIY